MPAPFGSQGVSVTQHDVAAAAKLVRAMSLPERAGSVIMASSTDVIGNTQVRELHLGGVILMGSQGIIDGTADGTPDQVAEVVDGFQEQRTGEAPLLIATDQEYGDVTRLVHGFTEFPGAAELAASGSTEQAVELTELVAAAAAREMLAVGVSVDFAPDADVLPYEGESAIGDRSYGADPERAGELVAAAVRGYQSAGLAATIKHFPGIGRIAVDTHEALPTLHADCAEWNQTERVPMMSGAKAGSALAMTGHIHLPSVGADDAPASLSPSIVTDLLRGNGSEGCEGLGYRGIAVTDSMQMAPVVERYSSGEAAVTALAAGQDLLLMPADPAEAAKGIVGAVERGELATERLDNAAIKVLALRLALQRTPRPSMDVIESAEHLELASRAAS